MLIRDQDVKAYASTEGAETPVEPAPETAGIPLSLI